MSERVELAKVLYKEGAYCGSCEYAGWDTCADCRRCCIGYAAAAWLAGYRKPRAITTVEELNALPVGSVVLRNGRAFQRFAPTPAAFDEYQMWRCPDGGFVRSTKDGSSILPATVVHEASL